MTTPTEAMHRTIPGEAEGQPLTLGQRIWCLVKDPSPITCRVPKSSAR
jgi:hypothetical protein